VKNSSTALLKRKKKHKTVNKHDLDTRTGFSRLWGDALFYARVSRSFFLGFFLLRKVRQVVTVFGSARLTEVHPHYQSAREIGAALAHQGFTLMTGGGPSVMEAANRGAFEAGGMSIGLNIVIPREQAPNPYLTHAFETPYFFIRKVLLIRYTSVFIVYPGGVGTWDELFEVLILMVTGKMPKKPIILVDRKYWEGLLQWIEGEAVPRGMLNGSELSWVRVVDSPAEILATVTELRASLNETGEQL
jgi:uncharacterized protein (TIGR00730 family)